MRIAIIDLTTPFATSAPADTAGALIAAWIAPALPEARLTIVPVATGAPLPRLADHDGFILSGSEKGVYDDAPWMADLRALLADARAAAQPLVGLCFGHQIMADTFGGRAELVGQGMVVGVRRYRIEGRDHDTHVWHQDQVTRLPPGARILGAADYCPMGVLAYDFPAFSTQFHPEFHAAYLMRELERAAGVVLPADVAGDARRAVAGARVAPDLMAARAAQTLRTR
ncbi:MAG: type 1 glutamine amidotransferase [Rhodobacteraceae bacterium]|nr:type 1 glutamine amidotransferase [Paracoccaceae bacterium]